MPWEIRKSDACPAERPWGVFKEGETADPLGCHESEEAAKEQQAALYANEPGARKMAVKFVDGSDTLIEGLAVPYGGSFGKGKDLHGEDFGPDTDLALDWFPEEGRPFLFHH